jgi:hypothetical protein
MPVSEISVKQSNPKDSVGTRKWRQYCVVPTTVVWALGVAMLEGARKYGRSNYRVAGVRASVYVDAAKGHIDQFWEGENVDDESKIHHLVKGMASLAVLYDAIVQNKWVDDRPPATDLSKLRAELQAAVDHIFERIPESKPAYVEGDQYPKDEGKTLADCKMKYPPAPNLFAMKPEDFGPSPGFHPPFIVGDGSEVDPMPDPLGR